MSFQSCAWVTCYKLCSCSRGQMFEKTTLNLSCHIYYVLWTNFLLPNFAALHLRDNNTTWHIGMIKNYETYIRGGGLKISCKIKYRNKTKEVLEVISILAYLIHKLVNFQAYMFECLHTCIRAYLLNWLHAYLHIFAFFTFLLLFLGWWVNILGMEGDHLCQLSPGFNFVS